MQQGLPLEQTEAHVANLIQQLEQHPGSKARELDDAVGKDLEGESASC